ncbi:MAG TPA: sulfotransferase [Ktedonobacteraceae bacterium]|nr:sulfotransferase [Ktedonobacteraceae bacterium]
MTDQSKTTPEWNGLKVIGAGFGRTGTLSVKNALEELDLRPCYHMTELFHRPDAEEQWEAIVAGAPVDWNAVFAGYQATVDWPACTYYQELMQVYPEAKVLLTVRDPEKWYESVRSTIYVVSRQRLADSRHGRMIDALIWKRTFDGKFEDKDYALAVFHHHIEEVKQHVPPEKLLVFDVKEGWEPLCAFVGAKVPEDTPFPQLNDRGSFLGNRQQ